MRKSLFIWFVVSLFSCNKNSASNDTDTQDLAGRWRASAYSYLDDNGSRKWEPEHVSNPASLTFDKQGVGTFNTTVAIRAYFSVLSGNHLQYTDTTGSSYPCDYQINSGVLTITGDCDHFCGEQYVR